VVAAVAAGAAAGVADAVAVPRRGGGGLRAWRGRGVAPDVRRLDVAGECTVRRADGGGAGDGRRVDVEP